MRFATGHRLDIAHNRRHPTTGWNRHWRMIMPRRALGLLVLVALVTLAVAAPTLAGRPSVGAGLLPDMRTVVPAHLNLVNEHQTDILRFSNGVANTGAGPWALRPEPSIEFAKANNLSTVSAIQEIRDSGAYYKCGEQPKQVTDCYNVVSENLAGSF